MTVQQLYALKQWQVANRSDHPAELHAWDVMLTLWLMGWMGVPTALILWQPAVMAACMAFFFAPTLYVRARLWLHELRRVRCDWRHLVVECSASA